MSDGRKLREAGQSVAEFALVAVPLLLLLLRKLHVICQHRHQLVKVTSYQYSKQTMEKIEIHVRSEEKCSCS